MSSSREGYRVPYTNDPMKPSAERTVLVRPQVQEKRLQLVHTASYGLSVTCSPYTHPIQIYVQCIQGIAVHNEENYRRLDQQWARGGIMSRYTGKEIKHRRERRGKHQ